MIKCFLSHSSKDKKSYVEIVARELSKNNIVYDELTFEEGNQSLEEILNGLDNSQIFVLFISEYSLLSNWVKLEITKANKALENGDIKRIFPIIIDQNITYKDERIPDWMREKYNLKYISRPKVAVRRIRQKLRELSWELHPKNKERNKIFVGRNQLINSFEERIDDFDKSTPICIIASGIPEIGRRSLIKRCFIKSNLIGEYYEFPSINLSYEDSLEDFIHKIYALGLSAEYDLTNFMSKSIDEKLSIAIKIVTDIQNSREIISIVDNGCIVTSERKINDWFFKLIERVEYVKRLTFAIASNYRLLKHTIRNKESIYSLEVPELERKERNGLLKRYSEVEDLNLSSDDLAFFSDLLSGYPGQIFYAVDLIKDYGVNRAKKESSQIAEFSSNKAQLLLSRYENDSEKLDFLYLLSEFDFINYEFIFNIVEEQQFYKTLEEFIASAVCETLGANGEYIRVNDTIRDYVRRNRFSLPQEYEDKLRKHLDEFLKTYTEEEKDAPDYLYSLKQALIEGKDIDSRYLIPSHFLKTMKELYDRHYRYEDVVKLADKVLANEVALDIKLKNEVRYYLCASLARLRKEKRFLDEVHNIQGFEHNFLLGFYYRLQGRPHEALTRLQKALEAQTNSPKVKREIVQVLLALDDFENALALAQENYENYPTNPFHIQAYFNCMINSHFVGDKENIVNRLLDDLKKINSEKAQEILGVSHSQFVAFEKNNLSEALNLIDNVICKFPESKYPKLTRFEISFRFKHIKEMQNSINVLEEYIRKKRINNNSDLYKALIRAKCKYLAVTGKRQEAILLVNTELKGYSDSYRDKLLEKLKNLSN
ncbi:MAG: TIR domain-containing protein [Nodularia sp. (in: cyanobacteria)]|nr:TIR domain-containing protein [Nodularia sp. (in: cyanobacteria)]